MKPVPAQTVFIAGTDTGVGKTHVSAGLLRAARGLGIAACGFKPVASGCRHTAQGLRNSDARALMRASGTRAAYEDVSPYAFAPAIAPHLAAREAGVRIDPRRLDAAHRRLARGHDLIVVEGAGGWQVPLDSRRTLADWVAARDWPVVLVVGMRLGCLNHALLSAESITRRARLLGWVASVLPPRQPRLADNLADLRARLPAPCLGVVDAGRRDLTAELCAILGQLQAPAGT